MQDIQSVNHNNLVVTSLNINGLNNINKRKRVLAKFRKEEKQVIFLQETHLSKEQHLKFKKWGYKNLYFSYNKHKHNRGG